MIRHRHLDVDPATPLAALGLAALDDLLDRGDLADWAPLLREVYRDPHGVIADRVLQLVEGHPMYGTSRLWRSWIEEQRTAPTDADAPHVGAALKRIRAAAGLTQATVGERMGMTQAEVSKLERRRDVRVSTLRAYVAATGGQLELVARIGGSSISL